MLLIPMLFVSALMAVEQAAIVFNLMLIMAPMTALLANWPEEK
jgi:hypothetical protein